jgi:hypothetical protein
MSNISSLGNQIHINQNVNMISNKFVNCHSRIIAQDTLISEAFEENQKRLKDTREMEESEAIDENLNDSDVYSAKPIFRKRENRERQQHQANRYIINDKMRKIDIKI